MGLGLKRRLLQGGPLSPVLLRDLRVQPLGSMFHQSGISFSQDVFMRRGKQTHLWGGEHVQAPGTHFAISGDSDEVMSILSPNNIYTVHRVL